MTRLGKTIISLISIGIVAVAGILIYIFWPAITGTINSNKYYSAEDVQESYDKGFEDGNKSETELTAEITYYKTLVDEYESEVNSLNKELSDLTILNNENASTIQNLTDIKNKNEESIENLQKVVTENNLLINDLNEQIDGLEFEVENLQTSNSNKDTEISQLNSQISNLQNTVNQLQKTNELNTQTIENLNEQILILNTQISELTLQMQGNSTNVSALNNKIAELEQSITYYEEYIASLENTEQVVATFEFDGSVYNIQVINKGSTVSVTQPNSTEYVIFNYWTVNGEKVDLNSYTVNTNTYFIADVTYKFEVNFTVNNNSISKQIVTKNAFATAPTNPILEGYDFDGWTTNGVDLVDISSYQITENITFVAKFTQLHLVTFMYENEIYDTQLVRNGEYAENIDIVDTTYINFNGWTIDETIVSVASYKITSSTIFVADVTYFYDVRFEVDGSIINTQIIVENSYATAPTAPNKTNYEFAGWSINGVDIVNVPYYQITEETTFIAIYNILPYGLFSEDGTMIYSWSYLKANRYIAVSNGVLRGGSNKGNLNGVLKISSEVTSIYSGTITSGTFAQINGLTGLVVPSTCQTIGSYAFYKCENLKEVVFEEGVLELNASSFQGCTSLTVINIPSSISSMSRAFIMCTGITEFNVHENNHSYSSLDGNLYNDDYSILYSYALGKNDKTFIVPDSVHTVARYAFRSAPHLENLILLNVNTVEQNAFYFAANLKTIYLSSSTYEVLSGSTYYNSPFYGCSSDLIIYSGNTSKPTSFETYWNWYSEEDTLTVQWNYSYENYLSLIGVNL